MGLHTEQTLLKNLSPPYFLAYLFQKYSNAKPTASLVHELFSKNRDEVQVTSSVNHPFDDRLRRVYLRQAENDPEKLKALTVSFAEELISLDDCQDLFGRFELKFWEDKFLSEFSFKSFRSVYITKVSVTTKGKLTAEGYGDFTFIHPNTLERCDLHKDDLSFRAVTFYFKQFG